MLLHKFSSLFRRFAYRACRRNLPLSDAILFTGSPRSGTTWISSVFARHPGILVANEPLHPGSKHSRAAGFSWRTFVEPEAEWQSGFQYINQIASGNLLTPQMLVDNSPSGIILSKRVFLKCVRANRILPWLTNKTDLPCFIVIVRNPFSVVASQIMHREFGAIESIPEYDLEYISKHRPELFDWANTIKTESALRAITWSIDQISSQASWSNPKVKVIQYETLVREPVKSFTKLLQFCRVTPVKKLDSIVREPSREAQSWSLVSSWSTDFDPVTASGLGSSDIDAVFDVIEKFGIHKLVSDLK